MKKYKNIIIYFLIFIIVMILAVVGYNYLSKNYVLEDNEKNNNVTTDSLQSTEKDNTTKNETVTLKQATDFNVINNER